MNQTSSGLRRREKLAYAVGDVCVGGTFNIVNLFYAIFLTDIIGLEAFYAAPSCSSSAFTTPSSTPSWGPCPTGRKAASAGARIYLILGAPAVLASFMLLFFPFAVPTQLGRFVLALICYLVFSTVISIISVPYYALSGELTLDYAERTSLLSYAGVLPCRVGGLLTGTQDAGGYDAHPEGGLYPHGRGLRLPFRSVHLPQRLFHPGAGGHEAPGAGRPHAARYVQDPDRQDLPGSICSFRCSSASVCPLCPSLSRTTASTILEGSPTSTSSWASSSWPSSAPSPCITGLARRFSKARVFSISSVGWILSGLLILLVKPDTPTPLLCACAFAMGFSMCGVVLMPNAMFGDVADVGELKLHSRQEGAFGGFECPSPIRAPAPWPTPWRWLRWVRRAMLPTPCKPLPPPKPSA